MADKDLPIRIKCIDALAGLADDNAKVQAAAANMLNLALTLPDAPSDLGAVLVRSSLCKALEHVLYL